MEALPTVIARSSLRIIAFLALACSLAGCQSLLFSPKDRLPVPSDLFTLASPDDDVVGHVQVITARHEDTLPDIARRFNLGFEEIVAANPQVDPWLPGEGTRVVLPTQFILPDAPREGIILNLATLRLFYFPKSRPGEPRVVITHPIGIGRVGWSTPQGVTKVVKKDKAPIWYVPESIRREHARKGERLPAAVPPGPDNPLGTHALRLALGSYLIHGTNKPYGIGMRVSHGCIQLYPEDIGSLYEKVPVGTPVRIVNQPFLAGWQNGTLYLEAHERLEDDKRNGRKALRALLKAEAGQGAGQAPVDWEKAERLAASPRGLPVPVLVGAPGLEEILASSRSVENTVPEGANFQPDSRLLPNREQPPSQAAAALRSIPES